MIGKDLKTRLADNPEWVPVLSHEREELVARNEKLRKRNQDAADNMGEAVDDGNVWHDNSAYDAALAEMENIDNISKVLGPMVVASEVVEYPSHETDVTIGSYVEISLGGAGAFGAYVVGQSAFLPKEVKTSNIEFVSVRSPMGQALLGLESDEIMPYELPSGSETTITVRSIDQTKTLTAILEQGV